MFRIGWWSVVNRIINHSKKNGIARKWIETPDGERSNAEVGAKVQFPIEGESDVDFGIILTLLCQECGIPSRCFYIVVVIVGLGFFQLSYCYWPMPTSVITISFEKQYMLVVLRRGCTMPIIRGPPLIRILGAGKLTGTLNRIFFGFCNKLHRCITIFRFYVALIRLLQFSWRCFEIFQIYDTVIITEYTLYY